MTGTQLDEGARYASSSYSHKCIACCSLLQSSDNACLFLCSYEPSGAISGSIHCQSIYHKSHTGTAFHQNEFSGDGSDSKSKKKHFHSRGTHKGKASSYRALAGVFAGLSIKRKWLDILY